MLQRAISLVLASAHIQAADLLAADSLCYPYDQTSMLQVSRTLKVKNEFRKAKLFNGSTSARSRQRHHPKRLAAEISSQHSRLGGISAGENMGPQISQTMQKDIWNHSSRRSTLFLRTSANTTDQYLMDTFDCGLFGASEYPRKFPTFRENDDYDVYGRHVIRKDDHGPAEEYTYTHHLNRGCHKLPRVLGIDTRSMVHEFDLVALPGCSITLHAALFCQSPSREVLRADGAAAWFRSSDLAEVGWTDEGVASVSCTCHTQIVAGRDDKPLYANTVGNSSHSD